MITRKLDLSEFDAGVRAVEREVTSEIRRRLEEVGARAVEIAKESGTYHDVTGRLRRSNKYRIEGGVNLVLYNEAPYARDVEARGEVVLTTAVLAAERMLNGHGDE